jgi:molecular chaperone HscB
MPNVPAAAAQASLLKPVEANEDYFSALGVKRAFQQDPSALEKRFYELSRALHPDRFSTAGPEAKKLSLERMSFVNQAYQTLKDPALRRAYLLELEKIAIPSQGVAHLELAESWFEIQDLMMEDPGQAQTKLREFESTLNEMKENLDRKILELERQYDAEQKKELLTEIARKIHEQNYLHSMERDVQRIAKGS